MTKMKCNFCGSEQAEGAVFCDFCGAKLQEEQPAQEQVMQETVQQEPVQQESVAEENPFATFETPAAAPKKVDAKKWIKLLGLPLAGIAVLAALVAIFWGSLVKLFGSPQDYYEYVENKTVKEATKDVTSGYGRFLELAGEEAGAKTKIEFNVSDTALDLLKNAMGDEIDLAWLDNVEIELETKKDGGKEQIQAAVVVEGTKLLTADVIVDMETGEAFISCEPLSDQIMKMNLSELMGAQPEAMALLSDKDFIKALPTEKELNKLITKYVELALENLSKVKESSEKVEVGDITEKLTVLEVEISEKDLNKMAVSVLKEAKSDKDLEECIKRLAKYVLKATESDMSASEMYSQFKDGIKQAIDSLNDADPSKDPRMVMTTYVNSKHEVVGRTIATINYTYDEDGEMEEDGETEMFSYITVRKGAKFAFEMKLGETAKIVGEGTEKNDVINGEFELISVEKQWSDEYYYNDYEDEEEDEEEEPEIIETVVLIVEFNDLSVKNNYLNGNITLKPSEEMLEEMDLGSMGEMAFAVLDPAISLDITSNKDKVSLTVSLANGGDKLFGVSVSSEITKGGNIKTPDEDEVVSQYDWLDTVDTEKVMEKLEETSISEDLIDMVTNMLGFGGSNYYDDYYSSDYYY